MADGSEDESEGIDGDEYVVEHSSSVWGTKRYIEYQMGSPGSSMILTVPHGGQKKPKNIPDRNKCPCGKKKCKVCDKADKPWHSSVSAINDSWTMPLGTLIADAVHDIIGKRPHVVINHLHRKKMDANRGEEEAALGQPDAVQAWQEWHRYIDQAKGLLPKDRPGLLIDLHGQSHAEAWIELGYCLSHSDLDNGQIVPEKTTVRNLALQNPDKDFHELLLGENGLGGLLQSMGYTVIPSPENPKPQGRKYFTGGYNIRTYGSLGGKQQTVIIDAIQIESPIYLRNGQSGPAYARDLAKAITEFMTLNYP